MNLKKILSGRIHDNNIIDICSYASGNENDKKKELLYKLMFDKDKRVGDNAAWIFTRFNAEDNKWLFDKQNELIDEAMSTSSETKCRLILSLLLKQNFCAEELRSDFLDFCLDGMVSLCRSIGVRALCMKLAYEQCRFYKELISEFKIRLDMMDPQMLSPGVNSVRIKIMRVYEKIDRYNLKGDYPVCFCDSGVFVH